jgi:hypothetical protein
MGFQQGSSITDSILQVPTSQPAAQQRITAPPLSGPDSGVAPSHLPGVIKARERETVYSLCDEVHPLPTIENETITTAPIGGLVFAAAGTQLLLHCGRAQVFEIDIQLNVPGGVQLFEGSTGSQAISGHFQVQAGQLLNWNGKIVNGDIFITVDQPCVVQFEARWRIF